MCLHDYHRSDYLLSDRLKLTPFNVKVRQIYVDDIENNEHNSIHEQSNEITNRIKKPFRVKRTILTRNFSHLDLEESRTHVAISEITFTLSVEITLKISDTSICLNR